MPNLPAPTPADEHALVQAVLTRMATEISLVVDREFAVDDIRIEHEECRPAGGDRVHISFKLGIERARTSAQGCLLVPLPDALALAGFMMMMPDESVARERGRTELDGPFKEALLEVGKLLAGACDAVLRQAKPHLCTTRSDGCQGVRADIRPALSYAEGDPLLVARGRARVHDFEPFELILMLPGPLLSTAAEVLST